MDKIFPRVYWDACAWISFIQKEMPGGVSSFSEPRYDLCRATIRRAEEKKIEIVTSAYTLAEVCKRRGNASNPGVNIPAFFDHPYILLVNVDKEIGLKAQAMQLSGVSISPQDATHIATALIANVPTFHTFDGKLIKLDNNLVLKDGRNLRIMHPESELPLPPLLQEIQASVEADPQV